MSTWRFNIDFQRWEQTNTWLYDYEGSENSLVFNEELSENSDTFSYLTQESDDFHEEIDELTNQLFYLRISAPAA